ncbi:receptor-type guanylate cyclase Gyc76C-like [Lycorma delicatula]|uniref:receptor-type guanylate cyclase Gyc76C-like n=1 Tax=Lycorma delicatula TaxID=130591 RepID=UPI003F517673
MRPGPFRLLLLLFPLFVCRQLLVVAVQETTSDYNTATDISTLTAASTIKTATTTNSSSTLISFVHTNNLNNSFGGMDTTTTSGMETTFPTTTATPPKKNLTVGYLTAIKGELKDKQGLAISGALGLALEEVNNDTNLLPNVNLVLKWNDTRGDTVLTTRAITEMLCEGVTAFFGPEGSCYVEAIVAQSRNIPMISYKCSDYKASQVPTFARTEPPDTQVTKSVISLLKYYNWKKFSIIAEDEWETVAKSLQNQAFQNNLTVNHYMIVADMHECCIKNTDCCQNGFWYQLIRNTKNGTRIYVFLGTVTTLHEMMATMQTLGIFDNGEYMVIYVDPGTYSYKEAYRYLWRNEVDIGTNCITHKGFLKRARSLLVIVLSPPNQIYQEEFSKRVRDYNLKEPFSFPTPPIFSNNSFNKYVSIYASYLYDSVKLYARALDKLLNEEPYLNDTIIEQVASNGTRIIQTIIKNRSYQSITGTTIKLDANGDSEGNYTVLALKPNNYSMNNFSCSYYMIPVGQFQQGEQPVYRLNTPSSGLDWPGKDKPEDEPSCGFLNELCPKDSSQQGSIIVASVLGLLLFCTSVITLSIYRKWKIEQEIEGLLWKIDLSDLIGFHGNENIVASPSKVSLMSATSYESRCGAQVFALTGQYRGVMVRIKELKFSKKKDIARNVMKEMRLLREFRHDNVNTFIGAVVEPMRVLIVTDYCAKGSLYDIVENEDIKLDKMFIASLVHDLIKGMIFLHSSLLCCHGNLKSSNCVVTSRWVLQVTDFGLHELRHCAENDSIGEHQYYRSLLWKAPELLRDPHAPICGTPKADVYAFAIIMHEIIGRRGPFGACGIDEPKEIIKMVKKVPEDGELFRPGIDILRDCEAGQEFVLCVIQDCWAETPEMRPDFTTIRSRLKNMKDCKQRNIMDQMMEMMEKYANNLEDLVNQRTLEVFEEKRKTEDLLHRMLPAPVADRLTRGFGIEPESFDLVTIYFSDIVGFTSMSAESTPLQVVNFLNDLYTLFDRIIRGYDVYKVETIGDAYMVVSGLPIRNGDSHAGEIASMSLDLLAAVRNHRIAHRPSDTLKLRIGVHTGPVVAGVVGLTMPRYCLFGDTVNTASRMESNGEPLRIHISKQCRDALLKIGGYETEERGIVNMKGKGNVLTYWLIGATEGAVTRREVDVTDLPPLFCRPRRSPKLVGGGGDGSRRQSAAPRGNSIDRGAPEPPPSPVRRLICEARSLDPFPNKHYNKIPLCKRSCHSLQENSRDGVIGNGSLVSAPLLNENKKWRSLETVSGLEPYPKKLIARSSIRSWLFGLFNSNPHRNSDISLRKIMYSDLQTEKEGIV